MIKPSILLADDHSIIVEGLRSILSGNYEIVGTVDNGIDLVKAAELHKPDAVLLDISMPLMNGMEAARKIKATVASTKLLFVTQKTDREYVRAALEIGVSGYISKQRAATEAEPALKAVLAGRYYVSPLLRTNIPDALFEASRNPSNLFERKLTNRQIEVLQLVAEGKSNKEIAAFLAISVKTVDYHKASIMGELNMRSTAELTRYALEHGLIGD